MPVNVLLLNRANSAMISRDYALAARLYKSLIDENPGDMNLLVRLGNVYIKSGEDEKALAVFQKLLETDSQNEEILLALGGIFRRLKRYEESIEILNKALKAGAKEEDVYYNLGFTYKLMGKYEDAIGCFEVVVTLNPVDVLAYNHLGAIYELNNDHEGAIAAYQKALKIDPNHPILHLNLAKAYENSENVGMAIREYEKALRYKPGWDEAYCDYAKLLLKLGRVKDAQSLAEQGIALNAHNVGLQSVLGDIYMAESDYESAEKSYANLIQTEGKEPSVLKAFVRSLEAQGKNVEALDAIRKARDAFPDDEQLLKESAAINLSAEKILEASRDIKELIDKDRNDLETLDLAGQYYICTNDERRAQKAYKKIESTDSKYKKHLTNASNRYKQKGDLEKAETYINRYLVSNPDDAKALVSLASIEERLGNMGKALENYNKALTHDANNHIAKISATRLAHTVGIADVPVAPAIEPQKIQEDVQESEPFEVADEVEQPILQEEIVSENQVEENVSEDDDTDALNLFEKSPLVDDDEELDFFGLVDSHEGSEVKENVLINVNLPDEKKASDDEILEPRESVSSSKSEAENSSSEVSIDASALAEKMAQMTESTQRVLEAASVAQLAAATVQMAARQIKPVDDADEVAKKLAEEKAAAEEAARKLEEEKEAARKAAEEAERKLAEEKAAAEEAAKKLEEEKEAARKAAEEAEKKLAEEKAAAEEAARKLEEEKAALEEAAKELREEKEAFRKTLEEALEDEETPSEEEGEDASSLVPAVENILKDEDGMRDFESQIKLFKTLLALSESLPSEKKKEFMQSRARVSLEYVIATLEGEPGLLKTSSALRKSGALANVASEEVPDADCSTGELLETVVGDLKTLSQNLAEKDLSIALTKLADGILEKN